jgi:hypothetical protein
MSLKAVYEFLERWLGRGHLLSWLLEMRWEAMFALGVVGAGLYWLWNEVAQFNPLIISFGGVTAFAALMFGLNQAHGLLTRLGRSSLYLFLEVDPATLRYGLQTFPGVTYLHVSVKSGRRLTKCKFWIARVEFRENRDVPLSLVNNERHQCRWSRADNGASSYEIDIDPSDLSIRANIGFYTDKALCYDPPERTPSNVFDKLQRIGEHRFEVTVTGFKDERHSFSTTRYLYVDWRGPKDGAFLRLEDK